MTKELNPYVWFGDREVSPNIPRHFVKAHTPITNESKEWVLTKLSGRYGIAQVDSISHGDDLLSSLDWKSYIFFEDPSEATIYELRWAGNN